MGRDTDNKDKVPLIEHLSTNGRGSTGHPAGVNRALYKYIPLTIIVLQTTVMVLLLRYSKTQKVLINCDTLMVADTVFLIVKDL